VQIKDFKLLKLLKN